MLGFLDEREVWPALFVRWELALLEELGFVPLSQTLRMYRGSTPVVSLADVYGLACLELG